MKINRGKNRLEKLIMNLVRKEIKPHWGKLWGQKKWCTPAYCGIAEGDGRQVVWLKTGDSRPDYYILRIDSKTNVDDDEFDPEIMLERIDELYGNESVTGFPMLSVSNGYWWGSLKTF